MSQFQTQQYSICARSGHWRVYEWWPLERFTIGPKPSSSGGTAQMLRKGVKHTQQKQKAVREQHKFANRA